MQNRSWEEADPLPKRYGALEAGGTKMVLSVLDEAGTMLERQAIPT